MGRPNGPPSRADVLGTLAIRSGHLQPAPELSAPDACTRHLVLGPPAPKALRDLEISTHPVRAHLEQGSGMRYTKDGSGSNVLGDPRMVLTWPANHLSALGIILEKGQVMATGTCMPPLELQAADSVLADFGHLGDVRMTFSET